MLDTDICSYIIRERPVQVLERFKTIEMNQLHISVITYAELLFGVEHSSSRKINKEIVDDFVKHLSILSWGEIAAEHYGNIRVTLQSKGKIIGAMDLLIAAHARSQKMVLVTNNDKHFKRVPKLKVENWAS